jgi:hypothetical protein
MNNESHGGNGNGTATLYYLQRDVDRHDKEIARIDQQHTETRLSVERLSARVGVFATLGAVVGGGLVSLLLRLLAP